MSFCKLSSDLTDVKQTSIDNAFITEFLPNLNPLALKVYLYGLYVCQTGQDKTLADFEKTFNLSADDIISLFKSLEELNLVDCIELNNFEVRYLPIKNSSMFLKKYDVRKYKDFNLKSQSLLKRQIDINEYNQYYYQMEKHNIDADAILKIIEYCIEKKDNKVSANYILTLVRNWAHENIKTLEDVENKINQDNSTSADLKIVLNTLGLKRASTFEERQLYLDWTTELDYTLDVIVYLAKNVKAKNGNFLRLNALVNKCFELKMFSKKEIEEFFTMEQIYFDMAKLVCKNLGVRYENLSVVVETFVTNWAQLGFDQDALNTLSLYCFKNGIKNLSAFDTMLNKMYKLGLVTSSALNNYILELTSFDSQIKNILLEFGIDRYVNKFDRQFFNTWIHDWHISKDLLDHAVSISKNKIQPMQFLNRVLSIYNNKQITTVEQAKKEKFDFLDTYKKPEKAKKLAKVEYSKEELSSLFDNVHEVEL